MRDELEKLERQWCLPHSGEQKKGAEKRKNVLDASADRCAYSVQTILGVSCDEDTVRVCC